MQYALAGNYRTLLIELMVTNPDSTVYIFQDSEQNDVEAQLKKSGYTCFCYYRKRSKNEILNLFAYYKQDIKLRRFLKSLKIDLEKDIVMGCDHICALFKYFRYSRDITVIEEGFSNYTEKDELYKEYGIGSVKFLFLRCIMFQWDLFNYKPYGYDSSVKEIWLTGLKTIPSELAVKTKRIDLEELWNCSDQLRINSIFRFNIDLYNEKCVIITQPLSEDGGCSEERKIQIYSEMMELANYPVTIKRHPRDNTDYNKFFKGVKVDSAPYPFELLILNKARIKQVLTITSTVAYQCIGLCDVSILGTKNYPELQNRLGVHEGRFFRKGEKP